MNAVGHNHTHQKPEHSLDLLAISISALCLIHCLAGPLVLVLAPTFFAPDGSLLVHAFLGLTVIALASMALWRGYRLHHNRLPLALGSLGSVLLVIAFFAVETHHHHVHLDSHILLTVIGSACLITAHVLNLKSCPGCLKSRLMK